MQRKKIEILRETLVNSNHSLAESNLELEPRLQDGRNRLVDTYKNRWQLQEAFDSNKKKLGLYNYCKVLLNEN